MNRKVGIFILLICSQLLLTGCWGKKELTELAFIIAVGFDRADDGDYIASFQIVSPSNVAGTTSSGGNGLPVAVYTIKAKDIVSLAKLGSKRVSRRLYFAHTNLIVIGEKLAREGMLEIFDALERDTEFRSTTSVVIARNTTAENVLQTLTPVDKIPANKIIKTVLVTQNTLGENLELNVHDVINGFVSTGKEPVINGFSLYGDIGNNGNSSNLESTKPGTFLAANGLGLIRDGKLIDWVSGDTAKTVVAVQNKVKSTSVEIPWKGKKHTLVYTVKSQKTKPEVIIQDGKPSITLHIKSEGIISQANTPIDLTDVNTINILNKKASEMIENSVQRGINRVQKDQCDVFGFGDMIHRKDPKLWKKLEKDWDYVGFKKLKVDVKADVFIRRTGLRNKPFFSNMGKE